jgi:hypothetical protein
MDATHPWGNANSEMVFIAHRARDYQHRRGRPQVCRANALATLNVGLPLSRRLTKIRKG